MCWLTGIVFMIFVRQNKKPYSQKSRLLKIFQFEKIERLDPNFKN